MVNYRACEANALVIHLTHTHTHTKVKIAITDEIQYTQTALLLCDSQMNLTACKKEIQICTNDKTQRKWMNEPFSV